MFRVSFSSDLLDKSWSRRRVNYFGDRRSFLHDYPENARDGRWRRRTYRNGGGWILIQRRRGTDQDGVSSRKFSGEEDRCGVQTNPEISLFCCGEADRSRNGKCCFSCCCCCCWSDCIHFDFLMYAQKRCEEVNLFQKRCEKE